MLADLKHFAQKDIHDGHNHGSLKSSLDDCKLDFDDYNVNMHIFGTFALVAVCLLGTIVPRYTVKLVGEKVIV